MIWTSILLLLAVPQEKAPAQEKLRTVEVIAPSITCHSRFIDSLRKEIRDREEWIESVEVINLHKRVLKERPKFDFGNDVSIVFSIKSDRSVRQLAKVLHHSGRYANSELWLVKSGHKMKDLRDIPFSELLKLKSQKKSK